MARTQFILACGLCAALGLSSCGSSQDSPSQQDRAPGGSKESAPLARGIHDPGILADATTYQPAKVPGSLGPGPAADASKAAPTGGDADAQVRAVVGKLSKSLSEGQVEEALKLFNAEHVRALVEDKRRLDTLFATFNRIDDLTKSLSGKLDPVLAQQLGQAMGVGGAEAMKWDLVDATHASVTPNIAVVLFRPARLSFSLILLKQADGWKFQLDSPLTADDVAAIIAFHKTFQEGLDKVIEWARASDKIDAPKLMNAIMQALAGQPVDLGTGEPSASPDDQTPVPPSEKPQDEGGGDKPEPPAPPPPPPQGGDEPGQPGDAP